MRAQATPSAHRQIQRGYHRARTRFARVPATLLGSFRLVLITLGGALQSLLGVRGLRVTLNLAVAAIVLSLPIAATAATQVPPSEGDLLASQSATDAARAQTLSRGGTITAGRAPVTVLAVGVAPIREQKIGSGDTLSSMANFYGVSPEAIAFANGISDPLTLELGRTLRIPPAEGALYTVAADDTVEGVANRFKVAPAVIMDYNRLYFEPEHFAPGQLIFVPGAALPALVYQAVDTPSSTGIARAPARAIVPTGSGRLAWPVNGTITQYYWAGHQGTDIAAAYGTTIVASDDGVVSATGWVAVGGLRVCVRHANGLETCYYHTAAVYVSVGQQVGRGQAIAAIGLTGVTTGPHVHWECKQNGVLVNCLLQ